MSTNSRETFNVQRPTSNVEVRLDQVERRDRRRRHFVFASAFGVRCSLLALVLGYTAAAPAASGNIRAGRVLVVANSASAASVELASYYRQRRLLPPLNVLFISVSNPIAIDSREFDQKILKPIQQRRSLLGNAVDYVVFCRDVPYRVGDFSTTALLLFGGQEEFRPVHGLFGQERFFEACIPCHYMPMLPSTFLSAYTVAEGRRLIDNSLVRYPDIAKAGRFYFCDGAGPRGTRNVQIPATIAQLTSRGALCRHDPEPNPRYRDDILGQFTGAEWLELGGNQYLPGSLLDNLTSFGGYLLDNAGQIDLLAFVQHGVCGAYGTVSEPTNDPMRWANYSLPLRYVAGFNLIESYLQCIQDWHMGVVVGDPLMAPFAKPPAVKIMLPRESFRPSEALRVKVQADEGMPGQGLAWAELWLNDQDLLLSLEPRLPAGTVAVLTLTHENRVLLDKKVTVGAACTIGELLEGFAGTPPLMEKIEILRVGKRGNRLLVRWQPRPGASHTPATCSLRLTCGEKNVAAQQLLIPLPVAASCAMLDFGATPPAPGDTVLFTIKDKTYTVNCELNEAFEPFVQRAMDVLNAGPLFGNGEAWGLDIRPSPVSRLRTRLCIYPRFFSRAAPQLPIAIEVRRVTGSTFADKLPEKPAWTLAPAFALAETVLQPTWPTPRLEAEVELPTDRCWPGFNQLLVRAGTPTGAEDQAAASFMIDDPARAGSFTVENATTSLHTDLAINLTVPDGLATAYPELLLDGRVACGWKPGTRRAVYRVLLPVATPGAHQVQIQWVTSDEPRSPLKSFVPLARTAPQSIVVRQPVLAGAAFSPHAAKTGAPLTLRFTGPYLRDGLTFTIGGEEVEVKRGSPGSTWTTVVSLPAEGVYRIEITGDPATETFGAFPDVLVVKATPEARP